MQTPHNSKAKNCPTLAHADYVAVVKEQFCPRRTPLKAVFDLQHQRQAAGEGVNEFLVALRSLLADCDFADPTTHLTYQLVIRCADKELQAFRGTATQPVRTSTPEL